MQRELQKEESERERPIKELVAGMERTVWGTMKVTALLAWSKRWVWAMTLSSLHAGLLTHTRSHKAIEPLFLLLSHVPPR